QVMVGYDLLTYFYPYRDFLNASLAAGHLPLWNPSLFLGVPFLANIQTGVFYPPNWLTVGLPAPQAVNVSILGHVPLAGFFLYLLLRLAWRMAWPAALAGGLVFAFSGFLSQQVGHINQLDTAAWLPLLALLLHFAIA